MPKQPWCSHNWVHNRRWVDGKGNTWDVYQCSICGQEKQVKA